MRKNKYNNKKFTDSDGNKWDSERERKRYLELLEKEKNGEIYDLQRQVEFILLPAVKVEERHKKKVRGKEVVYYKEKEIQKPIKYFADFTYIADGKCVVEDVKISPKMLPKEYSLKKKLFFYFYKIPITEYYG